MYNVPFPFAFLPGCGASAGGRAITSTIIITSVVPDALGRIQVDTVVIICQMLGRECIKGHRIVVKKLQIK